VKISELKANLSAHLRRVSGGEEVVVCDRNRPIARIVPIVEPELMTRRYIPNPITPSRPITKAMMDAIWEEERADRA